MTYYINAERRASSPNTVNPKAARRRSTVLLGALFALVATSLVTLTASQSVGAQGGRPADLDPAECGTTDGFKPVDGRATDLIVAQCRALVKFRNAMFANEGNQNIAMHSMAQWGTGRGEAKRMNNWLGVGVYGNPLQVTQLSITHWDRGTNGQQNRANDAYLVGPVPELDLDDPFNDVEDSSLFSGLNRVAMNGNLFTGEFPEWIYNLSGLKFLGIGGNLTGPLHGHRFISTDLHEVVVQGRLSGSLPDFRFTDLDGNAINQNFTRLFLAGNSFSGSIPSSYSNFADGRPMNEFDLSRNLIGGNIPSWVGRVRFSDNEPSWHPVIWQGYFRNRMSFADNFMCIPDGFTMPTLYEANNPTTVASVQINFSRNRCLSRVNDSVYAPGPIRDLEYEIPSDNTNALKVSWKPPVNDSVYQYWLSPVKLVPDSIDNSVSVGDWCAIRTGTAPDSAGVVSATIDADAPAHPDCRFEPTKFAADVLPIYEIGSRSDNFYANSYMGESSVSPGWNIVHVKERKSAQEIGFKLGMGLNSSYFSWDVDAQDWVRWALADLSLSSVYPELGTSIITTFSRPPAWLDLAGLSSADENINVQLANGWNMVSAGGDIARPDDDEGAFFFHDALSDCDSLRGVIAILSYRARINRFELELPCHPNAERAVAREGSMDIMDDLQEYDSLFVYFNATLPVSITWDDTNKQYTPAIG